MTNTRILTSVTTRLGLFLLGLIILSTCSAPSTPNQVDEATIYAAVIRRIYTQDDTFGGTLRAPVVYVLTNTDDSVGDPDIDPSEPRTLSDAVRRDIEASLVDLSVKVIWIPESSAAPVDLQTGALADGGVIITLGNIHPKSDGSVLVSGSIYIANLAAGGQTYILEQVNGIWEVTGNTGVAWIS